MTASLPDPRAIRARAAHTRAHRRYHRKASPMDLLLFLVGLVIVVWGIITLIHGALLLGIVLIVAGLLVAGARSAAGRL